MTNNNIGVRVFQKQEILCPETEPTSVAAAKDLYWVALKTDEGSLIRGYSIRNTDHKLFEFRALWPTVANIYYLPLIQRVITLEQKEQFRLCRIYDVSNSRASAAAGSGTVAPNVKVMTLPVGRGNIDHINVCQQTNKILACAYDAAVGTSTISLWQFMRVPSPTSSQTTTTASNSMRTNPRFEQQQQQQQQQHYTARKFVHQLACLLEVHAPWKIETLCVSYDHLAYGGMSEVRVLKVNSAQSVAAAAAFSSSSSSATAAGAAAVGNQKKDPFLSAANATTTGSTGLFVFGGVSHWSVDPDNFVEIRFDSQSNNLMPSPNTTNSSLFKSYELYGEASIVEHPVFVNTGLVQSCTLMLHRRFVSAVEMVRSVHLIQSITGGNYSSVRTKSGGSPAGDRNQQQVVTRCLISTSKKGFLYDLHIHRLLFEYHYTCECVLSAVNSIFLYVLSNAGVEVWSIHSIPELTTFYQRQHPIRRFGSNNNNNNSAESMEGGALDAGCLLKFHPFIGLKTIACTNDVVVLLSKFNENDEILFPVVFDTQMPPNKASGSATKRSPNYTFLSASFSSSSQGIATPEKATALSATRYDGVSLSAKQKSYPVMGMPPLFSGFKASTSKGTKANSLSTSTATTNRDLQNYNVYVLSMAPVFEIYEEMLQLAPPAMDKGQPEAYLQFVLEAHNILKAKYSQLLEEEKRFTSRDKIAAIGLQLELHNYNALIQKSYGLLGDAHMLLNQGMQAAFAYAQSDRPISSVMQILCTEEQDEMTGSYHHHHHHHSRLSKPSRTHAPIMLYLDMVLFDNERWNNAALDKSINSSEICDEILRLYRKNEPHKLSTLILESCLSNYSHSYAMELLEDIGAEVTNNKKRHSLLSAASALIRNNNNNGVTIVNEDNSNTNDFLNNNDNEDEANHIVNMNDIIFHINNSNLHNSHMVAAANNEDAYNDIIDDVPSSAAATAAADSPAPLLADAADPAGGAANTNIGVGGANNSNQNQNQNQNQLSMIGQQAPSLPLEDWLANWSVVRPKDTFALALLLLDSGNIRRAVKMFSCIEPHCIVEFCAANPNLFRNDIEVLGFATRGTSPLSSSLSSSSSLGRRRRRRDNNKSSIGSASGSGSLDSTAGSGGFLLDASTTPNTWNTPPAGRFFTTEGSASTNNGNNNNSNDPQQRPPSAFFTKTPDNKIIYTHVPTLACILAHYFPWCLLEILVRLRTVIPVECALRIFDSYSKVRGLYEYNLLVEHYLCSVVCSRDYIRSRHLTMTLIEHYIQQLVHFTKQITTASSSSNNDSSSSSSTANEAEEQQQQQQQQQQRAALLKSLMNLRDWCTFTQLSFVKHRYPWLDHLNENKEINNNSTTTTTVATNSNNSSSSSSNNAHNAIATNEEHEQLDQQQQQQQQPITMLVIPASIRSRMLHVLRNAEGLLCCDDIMTAHGGPAFFEDILRSLDRLSGGGGSGSGSDAADDTSAFSSSSSSSSSGFFFGKMALKLICFASMGRLADAFRLLLATDPFVCLEVAKQYCHFDVEKWRCLTDQLLVAMRDTSSSAAAPQQQQQQQQQQQHRFETYVDVYEDVLWYLSSVLTPEQFLSLLPTDGNAAFFLPMIQHCFSVQCSLGAKKLITMDNAVHNSSGGGGGSGSFASSSASSSSSTAAAMHHAPSSPTFSVASFF